MTDTTEALAAIPAKYANPDPASLATLPRGGVSLSYMGHADVTLALLDIDPTWSWRPAALDDSGTPVVLVRGKRLVMWGYITVLGVERMCVGTCDDNKGDPEKELIGDLLRNGAMRFGIGTRLWSKSAGVDPAGSDHAGGYSTAPPRPPRGRTQPPDTPAAPSAPRDPAKATDAQIQKMAIAFREMGVTDRTERLEMIARYAREVDTSKDLTKAEAGKVLDALEALVADRKRGAA